MEHLLVDDVSPLQKQLHLGRDTPELQHQQCPIDHGTSSCWWCSSFIVICWQRCPWQQENKNHPQTYSTGLPSQQHQAAPAALEIRTIQRGEPSPGSWQAQVHSIHQQHQPGAATDDSTEKAVDVLCLIYMNIVCLVFYLETILSFENKINNIVSISY